MNNTVVTVSSEMLEAGVTAFYDWEENEYRLFEPISEYALKDVIVRILSAALVQHHSIVDQVHGPAPEELRHIP